MGMNYNVTFHNAVIPPRRYGKLIGWTYAEVQEEPERAARLALGAVGGVLDDWAEPEQNAEGIHLSQWGFQSDASYGHGDALEELLALCEPGAYIHEVDAEENSGSQWRRVLQDGGSIKTVRPVITWPGMEN